ncbi:MAG: PDZ domain-containing protein, partial [Ruminococcaceae bacterium]|nr:PDZ domain-containing protein [Oscillospiraceae bacterium]
LSIMEIARRNKPAVVAISTDARIQNPFGQPQLVEAAGSGFIITADGYVVTNYHVIQNSQTISVTLEDGRIMPAVITGSDPRNDIAVLKINGSGFPTVILGDSSDLETGELAVAIGNALGELSGTVTAGIISALDRQITIDNQSLVLLQTDAAINSGNSGGALINSFGEVIGINTAKNAGDGVEGLGFAIPINTAKPIIESLIQNGYVAGRPKLGIGTRDVSEQEAAYYNMRAGIYVRMVESGSSADRAGIAVGDIIIKADGKDTLTTEALNAAKESHKVGDTMQITLIRNGNEMTVSVVLQEDRPETMQRTAAST